MAKVENDLDIYSAVGNANTQRQEDEITAIMKKRILPDGSWSQQALQKLILKTSFQIFIYFEKKKLNNTVDMFIPFPSKLYKLENLHKLISSK